MQLLNYIPYANTQLKRFSDKNCFVMLETDKTKKSNPVFYTMALLVKSFKLTG